MGMKEPFLSIQIGSKSSGFLSEEMLALLVPFGNFLVMMKPQSLDSSPPKIASGDGSSTIPGRDAVAFVRKPSPIESIRLDRITGSPPINEFIVTKIDDAKNGRVPSKVPALSFHVGSDCDCFAAAYL
jgi:hypothetical protein